LVQPLILRSSAVSPRFCLELEAFYFLGFNFEAVGQ
jgi:hypothetical protein